MARKKTVETPPEVMPAELPSQEKQLVFRDGDEGGADPTWQTETAAFLHAMTIKQLFYSEGWVYITTNAVAEELSNVPLYVWKKTLANGEVTREKAEGHQLQKWLDRPNVWQDRSTFIYNVAAEYCLGGNSINAVFRTTQQLIPMPFEMVSLVPSVDGQELTYCYAPTLESGMPTKSTLKFNRRDVLHIRRPNLNSLYWGLSPFVPTRKSVLFDRYSKDYLLAFYQKGASPTVALTMDTAASKENLDRMLRSYEAAHTGRRNMRRPLLLPKGVGVSTIDTTIADQNFADLVKLNREEILNTLHVPKHVLGLQESGSIGSDENKQALKYFWTATIQPTGSKIEANLNELFKWELGPDYEIGFDWSVVPVLQEDEKEKAQLGKEMLNTHTLNEVRQKLYKLPPVPGGDVVISIQPPANPFGSSFNLIGGQNPAPASSETNVGDSVPNPETQVTTPDANNNFEVVKALADKHKSWLDKNNNAIQEMEELKLEPIVKLSQDLFVKMADAVVSILMSEKQKAEYPTDEKVPDRFIKVRTAKIKRKLDEAFTKFGQEWADQHGKELNAAVELGNNLQLELFMNREDADAIAQINKRNAAGRREMLARLSDEQFSKISKSTSDTIMGKIAKGMEDKKTLREIASDIIGYFKDNAPSRAEKIARTETLTAISLGKDAAMKDVARVVPKLKKAWINAGDLRVRGNPGGFYPNAKADHWHLQGEIVDYDEPFSNGLMFPRDPKGIAGEVINCRCDMLVVAAQDLPNLDIPKE